MSSLNKVMLIGNLGRDPETRYTADGEAIANASIATSERWTDKASGEAKEATEWHRVVFFGRLAEIVEQYVRKGSKVYVEGKLTTRKWTDKEGAERYTTEIRATQLVMLSSKPSGESDAAEPTARSTSAPASGARRPAASMSDLDDDIPF